ncbi:hypothetical protein BE20_11370 [Sorangium cellulosum]|nr:hypothetical protein BE20_11370 [Sorangium cellulosum]
MRQATQNWYSEGAPQRRQRCRDARGGGPMIVPVPRVSVSGGTISTGRLEVRATRSATLPRSTPVVPECPWRPITMSWASSSSAHLTISSAADPTRIIGTMWTPPPSSATKASSASATFGCACADAAT